MHGLCTDFFLPQSKSLPVYQLLSFGSGKTAIISF